jgi:hypothetical protein
MNACQSSFPLPRHEVFRQEHPKMDWIMNNFWIYMGILVLVLGGLVAVLFVVRKNQDN